MRICFATGEKQPIANPTVKLLFLHSGCCFEVVGTALTVKADGDDSGEYARLDGGATHALRQAKSSEIPHLWPVQVEMAMGSVTLYKCPAHNNLAGIGQWSRLFHFACWWTMVSRSTGRRIDVTSRIPSVEPCTWSV